MSTDLGFDAGTQSIEALEAGDIQGLVVQNPMRMGYEGVLTIVRHLKGEAATPQIDTGVLMVTPENMQQAEARDLLHPPLAEYLGE